MASRAVKVATVVGASCALAGAAVTGIAANAASKTTRTSPTSSASSTRQTQGQQGARDGHRGGRGGPHDGGRAAVHSESIELSADGTSFVTVTQDRGTLTAVDGTQLSLKEGTATVDYKTVTVEAAGTVTVERNHATAKLADLKVGDHVMVRSVGTTTFVHAESSDFEQQEASQRAQRNGRSETNGDNSWPSA